jgi:hypothetical protein
MIKTSTGKCQEFPPSRRNGGKCELETFLVPVTMKIVIQGSRG